MSFQAWLNTAGAYRTRIEEDCIQDLMYHGVLANGKLPKSRQILEPIVNILGQFHSNKGCVATQVGVGKFITSPLFSPLAPPAPLFCT